MTCHPQALHNIKHKKTYNGSGNIKKTNVVGPILLKTLTLFVQLKNRAKKAYV